MIIIKKRTISKIIFSIIIIAIIIFGLFLFNKINKVKTFSLDVGNITEKNLIEKVSELYLFPTNEVPKIATVSDPKLLNNESLSRLAEKDDKLFIFVKNQKAVLYRPSVNKIIDIVSVKNN